MDRRGGKGMRVESRSEERRVGREWRVGRIGRWVVSE